MKYLLDTNACIAILRSRTSPVAIRLAKEAPVNVAICSVVKSELYYGAHKSDRKEETLNKLALFLDGFQSVPFDDNSSKIYGRIRADLAARGEPIGPNDLMISAIALANDLTLVTHNLREFQRVKGLKLEDREG